MKTLDQILAWEPYTSEEKSAALDMLLEGINPSSKDILSINDQGRMKATFIQRMQIAMQKQPGSVLLYIDNNPVVPIDSLGEWLQEQMREHLEATEDLLIIRITGRVACMAAADLQRRRKKKKNKVAGK